MGVKDDQGNANFYFNDSPVGVIADPQFTQHFFDIWLSANSSFPKLTQELIGG